MDLSVDFPRLSTLFRNHSGLASPHQPNYEENTLDVLRRSRAKARAGVISWKDFVNKATNDAKSPDIRECFHSLRNYAQELSGDDQTSHVVDDAAMFLLNVFLDEPHVLNVHKAQLKLMFGTVTPALADKICSVVNRISSHLSDDCKEDFKEITER
ncbi:uncharacterized protein LOC124360406 [Homalodisca vitripennis]|uniref:uncharacterized protein LOC124360406 n=1 Tax=Homalodisca vitripennis TaxID=197043 RepID=UPI001EE9C9EB|nr:uncharacterized protein LOC124360406 [Homalodisca vitripennis]